MHTSVVSIYWYSKGSNALVFEESNIGVTLRKKSKVQLVWKGDQLLKFFSKQVIKQRRFCLGNLDKVWDK
jgi:hypothetical protein